MKFSLEKSIDILQRTPPLLITMLKDLPAAWTSVNEGPGTWSVYDIIGHLIEGEKTDWITRAEIILSDRNNKSFEPFDRFAQFEDSNGKSLEQLLEEFVFLRNANIKKLHSFGLKENDLVKTGIHPAFGVVTLSQLLATWVVHDLNHIAQISRVMAKQYGEAVGPWINYLGILKKA